jgi:Tfp pilus assembly protein PilP
MRNLLGLIASVAIASAALHAQAPAKPAAPAAGQPAAPSAAPATPPDTFVYQADGRRDPFVNLLGTGAEPKAPARRADGPAGFLVGEIAVRGVMQSHDTLVAMISGPDNKTYVVHQGDRLMDGTIKSITTEGLVVVQRVNDPLSTTVKQREVRKLLRSLEDGK